MSETKAGILMVVVVLAVLGCFRLYGILNPPTNEDSAADAAAQAEIERSERHRESMEKWYAENPEAPGGLTAEKVRVVRENRRGDDSAREYVFKAQIKALGERCDSVDSAIMGDPGEWTISCAPGYEYRLVYDESGKPTRAQRAQ